MVAAEAGVGAATAYTLSPAHLRPRFLATAGLDAGTPDHLHPIRWSGNPWSCGAYRSAGRRREPEPPARVTTAPGQGSRRRAPEVPDRARDPRQVVLGPGPAPGCGRVPEQLLRWRPGAPKWATLYTEIAACWSDRLRIPLAGGFDRTPQGILDRWDADHPEVLIRTRCRGLLGDRCRAPDRNWPSLLQETARRRRLACSAADRVPTLPLQSAPAQLGDDLHTVEIDDGGVLAGGVTVLPVAPVAMHRLPFRRHRH